VSNPLISENPEKAVQAHSDAGRVRDFCGDPGVLLLVDDKKEIFAAIDQ
jgi:hypothetical protein